MNFVTSCKGKEKGRKVLRLGVRQTQIQISSFPSYLCVSPWAKDSLSLGLSLLICEVGITMRTIVRIHIFSHLQVLNGVASTPTNPLCFQSAKTYNLRNQREAEQWLKA